MNTLVCNFAPILYHIILGRVKGFPQKTTKIIVTVCQNCYNYFWGCGPKNRDFMGYNFSMDKKALLHHIRRETCMIWDSLCELYTPLVHYNEPVVELNPYIWRCAGKCFQSENRIQMGYKFFKSNPEYFNTMMDVILPHEIIHQADWNLFGESEKICGHGKKWAEIMVNYGLEANPFHSMEISRK